MKNKIYAAFLLTIIGFVAVTIKAQNQTTDDLPNPFQTLQKYVSQNNYITPLFELKANEEKYLASPALRSSYLEMMIQLENAVGEFDAAYAYENMLYAGFPSTAKIIEMYKTDIADLKSSPVADYKMLSAATAIEEVAGNHQVVMINEEHRTPFHRVLTLELLEKLYKKGFRYFAAETVTEPGEKLKERGYPTQRTGFYTLDPVYADVIRTALKLGYKIVPYESMDASCRATEENPMLCDDRRERGQAQNLYERILKNDAQAKIFVHVGRGHNSKAKSSEEFNFMGYYFRELTKIEPLTIDQLRFSQRRDRRLEQPLYRFLTKENMLLEPSVFRAGSGKFYNHGAGYDLLVFHPRMRYENGRAEFLKMNGARRAAKIDLKRLNIAAKNQVFTSGEPILIQAFFANESANAVPADQFILRPAQKIPDLLLTPGAFRIRALDRSGKTIGEYRK